MTDKIQRTDRKLKYSGAIVDFYTDTVCLPNGNTAEWDYIAHRKGAAAVVAVKNDGKLLMVKQYRNALDRETVEIPAGSRDSVDEPSDVCAARELEEETGYRAGKLELLVTVCTTVAFCNECIDIYLATDLTPTRQSLDENEFVEIGEYTIEELTQMILSRKIQDSKTIAAILAYKEKYLSK